MNQLSEKEKNALESVIKHKNLEPYFFEKLAENKDTRWLDILKNRGFFDKTNVPVLSEGNYIEEWNVLNYVVSVMEDLVNTRDESQIQYVLTVLSQAAEISKNFRIFNQSIEIIKRTPISSISIDYLNSFLDYWLSCEYGLDMILNRVESELLKYFLADSEKALLTFEKFFRKSISIFSRHSYVLNQLLTTNKEFLINIVSIDPKKNCEIFIELLENESFVQSSTREVNEHSIQIQNIQDEKFKVLYNDTTFEKDFENREIDTDFIIYSLKPLLRDVNNRELIRQIKLLYSDLFNKSAYESIFERKDYLFEADDYLIQFLKVCLTESSLELGSYNQLLTEILKSNYDRVKKIAIFVIVQKWDILKDSFLSFLETETQIFDYIFRSYIYDDETKHLFELFDNNIGSKYYLLVNDIIDKNEYFLHERDDKHFELKWKQKRYLALNNVPFFQQKLTEAKKITGIDIELSPAIKFSGVHSIEDISPFSSEEIINMPVSELVIKMKNFREHKRWFSEDFKEISYTGFGSEIKNSLISYPDHFIDDLKQFNELQYEFIYYLLDGFGALVKQNSDLNYNNVIEFLILYCSNDGFWDESFRLEKDNEHLMTHKSVLKASYDFIIALVANDKIGFTKSEFELIYKFIEISINRIDFSQVEDVLFSNNDISFYSLNSLGGRFVRTLLELGLKIKRIALQDYEFLWENNVKATIEHLLNSACIDSYVIFGEYLANFSYVDEEWTKQKIKSITPNQEMWQYFMTGYLDSRVIYYEFYELMVENYLAALEYKGFIDKNIKERLGSHIVIGYINGFEEKTGKGLTQKVLDNFDVVIIEAILRSFYSVEKKQLVRDVSITDVEARILKFWTELLDNCSKKKGTDDIKLIKEAVHVINNFSKINELIFQNLVSSLTYMVDSFETHYVVDYCERLVNNHENDELVTSLIFELFTQCVPSFPEEKIKMLLQYLKRNNEFEKLDLIQHAYLTKTRKSYVVEYVSEIQRII